MESLNQRFDLRDIHHAAVCAAVERSLFTLHDKRRLAALGGILQFVVLKNYFNAGLRINAIHYVCRYAGCGSDLDVLITRYAYNGVGT